MTAEQIGFGITWLQSLKDRFCHVEALITVTAEQIGLGIIWSQTHVEAHITVTAEQIGLGITWSQNLKDRFLMWRLIPQ